MSKADSKLDNRKIRIPPEFGGLVQEHYNRYLVDSSLSDFDVLLLSVYSVEYLQRAAGAGYEDTKSTFVALGRKEDNFRKSLYLARAKHLATDGTTLHFTALGLETLRMKLGQVGKSPVYVVKSGQPFSGIRLFEEFLSNEAKASELMLCDPYVSHVTLFPLAVLAGKIGHVKLLTSNIFEPDKFHDYEARLTREAGMTVETRISKKIHDRYLLSGEACWSIGGSIKDIGNKDTILRDISEVSASMRSLFSERWNESQPA